MDRCRLHLYWAHAQVMNNKCDQTSLRRIGLHDSRVFLIMKKWHACFAEQFSKADAALAIEPNADMTDAECQSQLSLEYSGLRLAVDEEYLDFDWQSWAKAACLVQKEAECFYASHLLSDDFQTISQARALDTELTEVLAIAQRLIVDLGPRINSIGEKLSELQQQPTHTKNCIQQEQCQVDLVLNVDQLISAWKEFLTHVVTLEGLSRDIKLAYSPMAVAAAEQNKIN